jgi:hypothetical protein
VERDLFTGLDLVFLDTTTIYFEAKGERASGRKATVKIIGQT